MASVGALLLGLVALIFIIGAVTAGVAMMVNKDSIEYDLEFVWGGKYKKEDLGF